MEVLYVYETINILISAAYIRSYFIGTAGNLLIIKIFGLFGLGIRPA